MDRCYAPAQHPALVLPTRHTRALPETMPPPLLQLGRPPRTVLAAEQHLVLALALLLLRARAASASARHLPVSLFVDQVRRGRGLPSAPAPLPKEDTTAQVAAERLMSCVEALMAEQQSLAALLHTVSTQVNLLASSRSQCAQQRHQQYDNDSAVSLEPKQGVLNVVSGGGSAATLCARQLSSRYDAIRFIARSALTAACLVCQPLQCLWQLITARGPAQRQSSTAGTAACDV